MFSLPQSRALRAVVLAGSLYLLAAATIGILAGLGVFTFSYGQGASYFSDNPAACVNCHVMQDHYDAWQNSSHRHVASCNDCHLSSHPVGKWVTKADNGLFHSIAFTLDNFHEPIRIKPRNSRVAQNACMDCHTETVTHMFPDPPDVRSVSCVSCHSDVGHAFR